MAKHYIKDYGGRVVIEQPKSNITQISQWEELTFNDQCFYPVFANQLTGFYMMGTLVVKGLIQ